MLWRIEQVLERIGTRIKSKGGERTSKEGRFTPALPKLARSRFLVLASGERG